MDRRPTPGVITVYAGPVRVRVDVSVAEGTVGHTEYPSPPLGANFNHPDVQTIYHRYMGYRQGKEPLASMAYFCLSFLEYLTEKQKAYV